jgi:hypothetical protein
LQSIADGRKITRAATLQGEPRQGSWQIGRGFQIGAQIVTQATVVAEKCNGIEPALDSVNIGERPRQPFRKKPAASRCYCPVDSVKQSTVAMARQGARQFEVGAGSGIDFHMRVEAHPAW